MQSEQKKYVFCFTMACVISFAFFISYNWVHISHSVAKIAAAFIEGTLNKNANVSYFTDLFDRRPGNAFLCIEILMIIALIYLTLKDKHGRRLLSPENVPLAIYSFSLCYATISIIIDPLEFFVAVVSFSFPLAKYYKKEIMTSTLVIICIAILILSFPLGMFGGFIVLIPTIHLISIRATNALKSRYSSEQQKLSVKLSSTQKKQIHRSWFSTLTWWDIIEPEIDELINSWTSEALTPVLTSNASKVNLNSIMEDLNYEFSNSINTEYEKVLSMQLPQELYSSIQELKNRDKNFNEDSFILRFKNVFIKVVLAIGNQNIETIQPIVSDSLYEQFKCRIQEQKAAGIKFKTTEVEIKAAYIARLNSNKDFDELHIKVEAQTNEHATDIATGELLSLDSKSLTFITEVWTFIRRPSAKTLLKPGLLECNCPNCGAPIQIGQATICPICNSYIRSGTYDWVLAQITQTCEWKYSNPQIIPNWQNICEKDKHLCIQHLEDKAALTFWIMKNLERNRNVEPLLRFADPEFYKRTKYNILLHKKEYKCFENISLGSVSLQAINSDDNFTHVYLLILWNGVDVNYDESGRIATAKRLIKPHREIFVLKRKNDIQTKIENTLTSAHCPNCGGPLTSSFDIKCQYCQTILNDASEWILERITQESDLKYAELAKKRKNLVTKETEKIKPKLKNPKTVNEIKSSTELIANAAQIILADGVVTDDELASYKKLCEKYEISEEKGLGILEAVKSGELVPEIIDKKSREAAILIQTIIEIALADGVIQDEELEYIEKIALKLGYSKIDIKQQTTMIKRKLKALQEEKEREEKKKRMMEQFKNKSNTNKV